MYKLILMVLDEVLTIVKDIDSRLKELTKKNVPEQETEIKNAIVNEIEELISAYLKILKDEIGSKSVFSIEATKALVELIGAYKNII